METEYELEATDRHYSLPVNPYSQSTYTYASSSTVPPQFTDSFNNGRRMSPPAPARSGRQSSTRDSVAGPPSWPPNRTGSWRRPFGWGR
ncbi:hypothetical protein MRQ36_02185 [Micromonospora sp. R77]|uniref:hypothetical protein n=1 Tax=Micromonospora sp. R77 TaxID=2925836 RepID=UPI001F6089D7|nr:hypothetical protein [Micromonospora sp. R77]MCI4061447.1 hypothetical protein [Micromonospora sp. R77]